MKPTRRACLRAAGVLIAGATTRPASAQTAPVRIATSPAEAYAQAFYARDAGFFQTAGVDVDVEVLATGAATSAAVAGGAADIGVATIVALGNAVARGLPFVLIAPALVASRSSPGAQLCVAANSPIRVAKDFTGKVIAVPALRQTEDLAVRVWLSKGGADVASVQIVESPFADMGPGLARGTFAGADISEPSLTNAVSHHLARIIGQPSYAIGPEYAVAGWFTTEPFRRRNPDGVKRVASALMAAAHWANTHRDESAAIVSRVNKVDVETIRSEVRPVYGEELRLSEVQPPLDAAAQFGFTTRLVKASELIGS